MAETAEESSRIEVLLNNFAVRSFRDTADGDYIAARLAFRSHLPPQFLWASLQALEKYLKCILLLNRVPAKRVGHDLGFALRRAADELPFSLRLSETSCRFVDYIDRYGRFRYLESSYHVRGLEVLGLDRAVWEVRRYCTPLNYILRNPDGSERPMLRAELDRIEEGEKAAPQKYPWFRGMLEKVIGQRTHPSRQALLWQNAYFGRRVRSSVRLPRRFQAVNAPLWLKPDILDEVSKYVFLPKEVIDAYRQQETE